MRTWFSMRAAAGNDELAEIFIYDEIGAYGVRAQAFADALRALGKVSEITVHINSPGGEIPDGLAIHNVLKRHPANIVVYVDGIAASMASVVAMAGDRVVMPENTFMMIHDPMWVAVGTSDEMRELADILDKFKESLASIYVSKSGLDRAEVLSLMAVETWLTAAEAVDKGFADEVEQPIKVAAKFDLRAKFGNAPKALQRPRGGSAAHPTGNSEETNMPDPVKPETPPVTAADPNKPADPASNVVSIVDAEKRGRSSALAYVNEVQQLCALAGQPDKAQAFIAAEKPVADIRKELLDARAAADADRGITSHHTSKGPRVNGHASSEGMIASMKKLVAQQFPNAKE